MPKASTSQTFKMVVVAQFQLMELEPSKVMAVRCRCHRDDNLINVRRIRSSDVAASVVLVVPSSAVGEVKEWP